MAIHIFCYHLVLFPVKMSTTVLHSFDVVQTAMAASFWSTMEIHPQQTPLGIIALLISRRSLLDSIVHSLEAT